MDTAVDCVHACQFTSDVVVYAGEVSRVQIHCYNEKHRNTVGGGGGGGGASVTSLSNAPASVGNVLAKPRRSCLLYTSDAADE